MRKIDKYLVVDDDPINNLICKAAIKKVDPEAEVLTYEDPEEALISILKFYSASRKSLHIILFLDINMPEMDGWEFLETFRNFAGIIKEQFDVFILTSLTEDWDLKQKEFSFVSGFLNKPLTGQKVKEVMGSDRYQSFG